jgi:hypothetical protein
MGRRSPQWRSGSDDLTRANQAAMRSVRQSIFLLLLTGGRDHTHRKSLMRQMSAQLLIGIQRSPILVTTIPTPTSASSTPPPVPSTRN